ncbi:S24 family peptidase, partial [Pseudoalteromonas sp. SCQQ13]|nr:S24 family peptidase [Pseudoalteromonas sp. SCQQ13]MBH0094762.1 S24 family peptidase [Pseudoalteromonas sp. SCQQ13]
MFVIPIFIEAGITGFESPAAEYVELGISIDELIIKHPNATFIGIASGQSMQEVGIFDGDLLV